MAYLEGVARGVAWGVSRGVSRGVTIVVTTGETIKYGVHGVFRGRGLGRD